MEPGPLLPGVPPSFFPDVKLSSFSSSDHLGYFFVGADHSFSLPKEAVTLPSLLLFVVKDYLGFISALECAYFALR